MVSKTTATAEREKKEAKIKNLNDNKVRAQSMNEDILKPVRIDTNTEFILSVLTSNI